MVSFPNSHRVSAEVQNFIDFYYDLLDSSRAQVIEESLRGLRTIQISEFLVAAGNYAASLPEPDGSVGRPELPSTPNSWTVEHVQLAVRYIYGVQAFVSEADADKVIAQLVEEYNNDNSPLSWSLIQEVLAQLETDEEIVIEFLEN